jgi:hypothetical protein
MAGSLTGGATTGGLVTGTALKDRLAALRDELDRRIAAERARPTPDEPLIRRLLRERLLARDRLAALAGCAMPRWARPDAPPAE